MMTSTDLSDIPKQGYLRCKSRGLGIWQKRWFVLRAFTTKGPCRLEKYMDETAARTLQTPKLHLLTAVVRVVRAPPSQRRHALIIEFADGTSRWFAADSDLDADAWVKTLGSECLFNGSGLSSGEPDILKPGLQKELQEQFRVYLMPSTRMESYGECLLQVTHEHIYLWDVSNSKVRLAAWPLTALRRYGSDLTKFTFEAGRHCATGEGMFVFHTLEGEQIYRKVHQATLAIAEAHQKMRRAHLKTSSTTTTTTTTPTGIEYAIENNYSPPPEVLLRASTNAQSLTNDQHQTDPSWYHSDNEDDTSFAFDHQRRIRLES